MHHFASIKRKKGLPVNSATISFRVKPDVKRRADELFARLGMSTSTGMNVLLMQTLAHQGFAAPVVLETPNAATLAAFDDLESGRDLSRYDSVKALLDDVP